MPTYEYKCSFCSYQFEKYQSFSEDPLQICPNCGNSTLRKVFSPAGIVFKGSGWYINDSKSSNNKSSAPAKSEAKSDSTTAEAKSETKSDSTTSSESKEAKPTAEKKSGEAA